MGNGNGSMRIVPGERSGDPPMVEFDANEVGRIGVSGTEGGVMVVASGGVLMARRDAEDTYMLWPSAAERAAGQDDLRGHLLRYVDAADARTDDDRRAALRDLGLLMMAAPSFIGLILATGLGWIVQGPLIAVVMLGMLVWLSMSRRMLRSAPR